LFKIKFISPLKRVHPIKSLPSLSKEKKSPAKKETSISSKVLTSVSIDKETAFREGFEKGKQIGEQEIKPLIELLKKVVKELKAKKEDFSKEMEEQMVKISLNAAKKIIKKEVAEDSEVIIRIAKEALKQTINCRQIIVKVNPHDWKKLREVEKKFLFSDNREQNISIEKDEKIKQGGCIIETEKQIIDAQIDNQIKEMDKALLGER